MIGWLLDTNVISELRRPCPDSRVRSFIEGQRPEDLFISAFTFAEIRYGIETATDPVVAGDGLGVFCTAPSEHLGPLKQARIQNLTNRVFAS